MPAIRFDVFAVFAHGHVSVANMACACPVRCIGGLSRPAFRRDVRFALGRGEAFRLTCGKIGLVDITSSAWLTNSMISARCGAANLLRLLHWWVGRTRRRRLSRQHRCRHWPRLRSHLLWHNHLRHHHHRWNYLLNKTFPNVIFDKFYCCRAVKSGGCCVKYRQHQILNFRVGFQINNLKSF